MTIKISRESVPSEKAIYALVQQVARTTVSSVADLTDNSAGVAGNAVVSLAPMVDVDATGTNLAAKAGTETSLGAVKDALNELAAKANAYADLLGVDKVVYAGGGTAADGTIGAISVAVAGAATGAQAAEVNASLAAINNATYAVATLVNKLAVATGVARLAVFAHEGKAVEAIPVDAGTAGDPGVLAADLNAELTKAAANVALIAAKLNALNAGAGKALVVAE